MAFQKRHQEKLDPIQVALHNERERPANQSHAGLRRPAGFEDRMAARTALVRGAVSVASYDAATWTSRPIPDPGDRPRQVTAKETVRVAHDPRMRQIAMLEGDRLEVLDMTIRPKSKLVDT